MSNILDQSLGYVECNVCGSGYNHVEVYFDADTMEDRYYSVSFASRCYPSQAWDRLTREEAVARVTRLRDQFASTRNAHHRLRAFLKKLESGHFERGIKTARARRNRPPAEGGFTGQGSLRVFETASGSWHFEYRNYNEPGTVEYVIPDTTGYAVESQTEDRPF